MRLSAFKVAARRAQQRVVVAADVPSPPRVAKLRRLQTLAWRGHANPRFYLPTKDVLPCWPPARLIPGLMRWPLLSMCRVIWACCLCPCTPASKRPDAVSCCFPTPEGVAPSNANRCQHSKVVCMLPMLCQRLMILLQLLPACSSCHSRLSPMSAKQQQHQQQGSQDQEGRSKYQAKVAGTAQSPSHSSVLIAGSCGLARASGWLAAWQRSRECSHGI